MNDMVKLVEDGLKAVEVKLTETLSKHEGQVRESGEASARVSAEVKSLAEEYKQLAAEQKKINDALVSIQQKGVSIDHKDAPKSIGQQLMESKSFAVTIRQ
jgi:predicted  nucleic acid-binding Zn-ribbon protein